MMVELFVFILKVKKSNLTNGVFVINNGKLVEYSFMWFPIVGCLFRLITSPMYLG